MTSASTISLHHRKYGIRDPKRRAIGWAAVIVVHAIVLWALITGTARDALKIMKKPMEAAVIQEVIIPPPPPPAPPPKEIVKPVRRKVEAPPPPFVPPPEVTTPPVADAPTITAVQTPPPEAPVIAPPPPPAAPVGRQEMSVVCPTQVKPEMPREAIRDGIEGLVKAQATIRGGKVVAVEILSGPRVYHRAVKNAMMQYSCISGPGDIIATQEFAFKLE